MLRLGGFGIFEKLWYASADHPIIDHLEFSFENEGQNPHVRAKELAFLDQGSRIKREIESMVAVKNDAFVRDDLAIPAVGHNGPPEIADFRSSDGKAAAGAKSQGFIPPIVVANVGDVANVTSGWRLKFTTLDACSALRNEDADPGVTRERGIFGLKGGLDKGNQRRGIGRRAYDGICRMKN